MVQQIAQALGETQLAALGQIKGRMRTIGSGNPPVRIIPIVGGTRLTPLETETLWKSKYVRVDLVGR